MNANVELLVLDKIEELGCVALEVFALGDEVVDDWTHETDVLGGELEDAEGLNGTGLVYLSVRMLGKK